MKPNEHSGAVMSSSVSSHDEHFNNIGETSHHSELDSHANMVVVCKHALAIAHTGKTVGETWEKYFCDAPFALFYFCHYMKTGF